jgi:hypothetical protein
LAAQEGCETGDKGYSTQAANVKHVASLTEQAANSHHDANLPEGNTTHPLSNAYHDTHLPERLKALIASMPRGARKMSAPVNRNGRTHKT